MALRAHQRTLFAGSAQGEAMYLTAPISFWGGVDPQSGIIIMEGHPQQGECIAGKILFIQKAVGSSSGSSILLELLACGNAPAAIVMPECDAILVLAVIVAREMGLNTIPMIAINPVQNTRHEGVVEVKNGKLIDSARRES